MRTAHPLFAAQRGLQWETAVALFCAYFIQGGDLNVREQLVELASGLRPDVGDGHAIDAARGERVT